MSAVPTIATVQCIPMRLPFHHWAEPPMFAGRPRNRLDSALVRVETTDGLVGWGESYCVEPRALRAVFESLVAPLAQGRRADDETLLPGMQRTLHNLGRSGPVVHALAGLDIALWDLAGKRAGLPVHALLGGKRRDRVPAYASLLQYYGEDEAIDRVVSRALAEGYGEIKLHERTAGALRAARRAAGGQTPIMVDTNCAWTPAEALPAIAAMADSQPFWIEEPLWPPEDGRALAALRRACGVPLAVGENAASVSEFERLIDEDAVDYVQPSVIKIGLTAAWAVSRRCAGQGGVRCAPQVAFFGPGYLAALHLLAAQAEPASLERLYVELEFTPFGSSVPIREGHACVPDGPGLGADPEPALAAGAYAG